MAKNYLLYNPNLSIEVKLWAQLVSWGLRYWYQIKLYKRKCSKRVSGNMSKFFRTNNFGSVWINLFKWILQYKVHFVAKSWLVATHRKPRIFLARLIRKLPRPWIKDSRFERQTDILMNIIHCSFISCFNKRKHLSQH